MAGRFARSLELAKASWAVVRADKELMWLPVLSVFALLLIFGSIAVPVLALGGLTPDGAHEGTYLGAFAFYLLSYFIALFFNTALVGAAMIRLDGGNPTLGDGLAIAWARLGRIFGYAIIAATVGLFLRALEERVGWLGQIIVKLIGVAWALATFMVVPILVTRDVGPVDAVKESAGLLRDTWGENLIGNAGLSLVFGVAYFALVILGGAGVFLGVTANLPVVIAVVIATSIAAFLVLATLHATMQGVYSAALYRYATNEGATTPGFDNDMLALAFKPKG
jgi:Family of unknown function (DUF6159)